MKVLIVGYFTECSKERIINSFPPEWEICIVEPGEEIEYISSCEILIPEHIMVDAKLLEKAKKLRLVQTGAGFDNVDIEACTNKHIWAANAAGVNAVAVAEHTLAFLLEFYKNIAYLDACMKQNLDEKLLSYTGAEVAGKVIGIIGLGAIGRRVAKYCHALDMETIAYDINSDVSCEDYIKKVGLEELIIRSDVVTTHIFLNEQTRGMINQNVFRKMKNSALYINTARGGIVVEEDLINAIKQGEIGGACLDVFEKEPLESNSELRQLKKVILTPHTAGMPDGLKFHKARYAFFL
ncbi:MAG: NAD(P)-dependent oxidoreductase, partial [Lachnospiraceae bacterium]